MSMIQYLYFLIFSSTMVFTPGPMTLFLMGTGAKNGFWKSMPAQLGATSAYFISLAIFAIGLTAYMQNNLLLMKIVQLGGTFYLMFLAYKNWKLATHNHMDSNSLDSSSNQLKENEKLYMQGILIGLLNPKVIVLFSVVIPQFAQDPATKIFDLLCLGSTYLILQFLSGCTYIYFGLHIHHFLKNPNHQKFLYRGISILLLIISILLFRT